VPPGPYRLVVRSFAYNPMDQVIVVPPSGGLELDIELALGPDQQMGSCEYERRLAGPGLSLLQPESLAVHRTVAYGAELRQTLTFVPSGASVSVHARIVNVGQTPATVSERCSPWATSSILIYRRLGGASVMCAPTPVMLAPGDSIVISTSGQLRGSPGRYRVTVHPVDPSELSSTFDLDFVAWPRHE